LALRPAREDAETRERRGVIDMSLKFITALAAVLIFVSEPVLACKGLNKLLEENFTDPEPAWAEQNVEMTIKDGKLQLTTAPGAHSSASYEGDFLNSADACVTLTAPDVKDESIGAAGIMFYLTPSYEFYAFLIAPGTGTAGVIRMVNGEFLLPIKERKAKGIKTGGNSINTLRVTWHKGAVTTYINDTLFARFKAKVPKNGKIGLYAESTGATWTFSDILVTDPAN
jgi:hypothetical protein